MSIDFYYCLTSFFEAFKSGSDDAFVRCFKEFSTDVVGKFSTDAVF